MLGDVTGIGQLKTALAETNDLLAQVLDELRRLNGERLDAVIDELKQIGTD